MSNFYAFSKKVVDIYAIILHNTQYQQGIYAIVEIKGNGAEGNLSWRQIIMQHHIYACFALQKLW